MSFMCVFFVMVLSYRQADEERRQHRKNVCLKERYHHFNHKNEQSEENP
jgi:hypothetical protein